jgi:hypothetical protein
MKVLSIILTIYVIALTLYPCADDIGLDVHRTEVSQPVGNSHDHDCDLCSPFCTCNCCGRTVQVSLIVFLNYTESNPVTLFFDYACSLSKEAPSFFWRPPKF